MIGAVRDGGIYIPLSQPISQQAFTCLNPWHPDSADPVQIDLWSSREQTWFPVPYGSLYLPLEHYALPLVRLPGGRTVGPPKPPLISRRPHDNDMITCGFAPTSPMCSMKAQMYDIPYIWPEHFRYPRSHYSTLWDIDRIQPNAIKPYQLYPDEIVWMDGHGNNRALGIKDVVVVDSDTD